MRVSIEQTVTKGSKTNGRSGHWRRQSAGRGCRLALAAVLCVALGAAAYGAEHPIGRLELRGRILTSEGKQLPGRGIVSVSLHSANTPFVTSALTLGGRFKFKELAPGPYTLMTVVRGQGEARQSVDVARSLADSRGRLEVNVRLRPLNGRRGAGHTVSARQLGIPYGAWSAYRRALQELKRNKVEEAVALLEKTVEKTPAFVEALNLLGTIYYHRRDLVQAHDYFEMALDQDENAYEPMLNLGGTLLNLNRYNEALSLNQRAAEARPEDPLAHSQLGVNYWQLGDIENALTHLNQAKKLDPAHFSHPQMTLAEIYLRRGDHTAAAAELEEFARLHPDHPHTAEIRRRLPRLRGRM